jgi:hypothetical protein
LDVVFVNDSNRLPVAVTLKQLVGEYVKALAQCCYQRFRVAAIPANLPVLFDLRFQCRCDDFSQGLMQHSSSSDINILQDPEHCPLEQRQVPFLSGV